jgi:hypothetical protein
MEHAIRHHIEANFDRGSSSGPCLTATPAAIVSVASARISGYALPADCFHAHSARSTAIG